MTDFQVVLNALDMIIKSDSMYSHDARGKKLMELADSLRDKNMQGCVFQPVDMNEVGLSILRDVIEGRR
jgi:hypothetical protein